MNKITTLFVTSFSIVCWSSAYADHWKRTDSGAAVFAVGQTQNNGTAWATVDANTVCATKSAELYAHTIVPAGKQVQAVPCNSNYWTTGNLSSKKIYWDWSAGIFHYVGGPGTVAITCGVYLDSGEATAFQVVGDVHNSC